MLQIDLPDEVVSHPVIMALEEAANDFISWSNDILSYDMEQSHHSTHNLVAVLMVKQGLDLQGAVDYCAQLCNISLQRFEKTGLSSPRGGKKSTRMWVSTSKDCRTGWSVSCSGPSSPPAILGRIRISSSRTELTSWFPSDHCEIHNYFCIKLHHCLFLALCEAARGTHIMLLLFSSSKRVRLLLLCNSTSLPSQTRMEGRVLLSI